MSGRRDPWLCGYAAGLAAMHRVAHDDSVVVHALNGDGLTLKRLRDGGAEKFDTDQIAKACRGSSAAERKARGDSN